MNNLDLLREAFPCFIEVLRDATKDIIKDVDELDEFIKDVNEMEIKLESYIGHLEICNSCKF